MLYTILYRNRILYIIRIFTINIILYILYYYYLLVYYFIIILSMCQLEFISAASKVLFLTLNSQLAFGKSNWENATVPHTTTFVTGNIWKPRVEFQSL